jgi:hypothetical protein
VITVRVRTTCLLPPPHEASAHAAPATAIAATDGRIITMDIVADADRVKQLDVTHLDD